MNYKNKLRVNAMALYKAPFRYDARGQYIFDATGNMVADNPIQDAALRLRGWGKLSYEENGADLQDEFGQIIVDALNAYYSN